METQQRSLIVTAAVGLIILAIIIGSIYYLVRFIQARVKGTTSTNTNITVSATPSPKASGAPATVPIASGEPSDSVSNRSDVIGQPQINNSNNTKTVNTGDFQLVFSKDWGVLKCSNSANFELDPTNGADTTAACGTAQKPVTILVNNNTGCLGEKVNLGNTPVVRSKVSEGGYIRYQWCTQTTPLLNITHRVSDAGDPATSKTDYSKQVEEMISKISFVQGS